MKIALLTLCVFCIVVTLIPFIPSNHWSVRGWEFPVLQIAVIGILAAGGLMYYYNHLNFKEKIILFSITLCLFYLGKVIFPYTFFAPVQVKKITNPKQEKSIELLSSNVLISNRNTVILKELIQEKDPDVVFLLEPDEWWEQQMRYLEKDYPYQIKCPLDNAYGLLFYSRLPLENSKINYFISDSIPSIFTQIVLPSQDRINLYGVHPTPPSPTENKKSTDRDAELLIVAKKVAKDDSPTIVIGDLNDVAWSQTTRLFQKISGLLDPRIGRRPYATFSAKIPLMRWPLDHVFHSDDFQLVNIEKLPHIKSDHFPIYINLALTESGEAIQNEPRANMEEKEKAERKIEEGQSQEPD